MKVNVLKINLFNYNVIQKVFPSYHVYFNYDWRNRN